jgi:hypothetical protein
VCSSSKPTPAGIDEERHFQTLLPAFSDPRYLRLNGLSLLAREHIWNCRANGLDTALMVNIPAGVGTLQVFCWTGRAQSIGSTLGSMATETICPHAETLSVGLIYTSKNFVDCRF